MKPIYSDTKSDKIYEILREEIISGRIKPKEKMNISSLATELGTSEIPVREALKRLQENRLLYMVPYTGYFVKEFTMEELDDLWAIRRSLEKLAIEQIVERHNEDFPQVIYDYLTEMDKCVKANDAQTYRNYNKEFHIELYRLTNNERLVELISNVWEEGERATVIFNFRKNRLPDSQAEHRELLEAIRNKDKDLANEILIKHRNTNLMILRSMMKK